jgi:hypothetical protein
MMPKKIIKMLTNVPIYIQVKLRHLKTRIYFNHICPKNNWVLNYLLFIYLILLISYFETFIYCKKKMQNNENVK